MHREPFGRSGPASLEDLQSAESQQLFAELSRVQEEFLATEPHPPSYIWPKDALRNWNRVWEYPYVLHHLRCWRQAWNRPAQPTVVDVGSGVTFFPFAVARLGCEVICIDTEPAYGVALKRAATRMSCAPGTIAFQTSDGASFPLEPGSFDAFYSISVLEHMPAPEQLIDQLAAAIANDGFGIITLDLDNEPEDKDGIGPAAYDRVWQAIHRHFELTTPRLPVHPVLALTTQRGPFGHRLAPAEALRHILKQDIIKPFLGRKPCKRPTLTCEGLTVRYRGTRQRSLPLP